MRIAIGLAVVLALAVGAASQVPVSQDSLLARYAIELAADRDPAPVSLGPGSSSQYGTAYDRFTQAHLAARVAFSRGTPLDPLKPPAGFLTNHLVIIANALLCGERVVRPTDVDLGSRAQPVPKFLPVSGAAIQKLLPGAKVPADAIAVQFAIYELRRGQELRISYANAVCSGSGREVSVTLSGSDPRGLERPTLELPPNQKTPPGPVTLNISGLIDLDGRLRYATAPEASTPIGAAALVAAGKMRFEPAKLNGSPLPWTAGVVLDFGVSAAPAVAGAQMTAEVPGLSATNSQCPVSADETYGVFASKAIRIGGGVDGPSRIQKYLSALRGPAGQGLRYESAGPALMGGEILETVDVQYAGLPKPVRIYFSTSREDRVQAPKGFTCAR